METISYDYRIGAAVYRGEQNEKKMRIAQLPNDEEMRLLDLAYYEILDTPAEKEFDELVELAGQICNCPVSLITLIDKDRQWFKSRLGTNKKQTSRDIAFCAHAILTPGIMEVKDASADERFAENPLVTGDEHIRFYAGAPIVSPAGHTLGTICVLDHQPHSLTKEQARALTILSGQVMKLLDLRVKNKLMQKRAEELIRLKDKSVQQALQEQEDEKQFIATTIHEGLAQSLAASRLYLGLAEESEEMRLPFLQKAKQHLSELLVDMRDLSNAITPSTIKTMPLEYLIQDYTEQLAGKVPFKLKFSYLGEGKLTDHEQNIAFFRVVEKWIAVLKEQEGVTQVNIYLNIAANAVLTINDNGTAQEFDAIEKSVIVSMIDSRIERLGGSVSFIPALPKGNTLYVTIPLS
jgi:signal transduction histidine kinase